MDIRLTVNFIDKLLIRDGANALVLSPSKYSGFLSWMLQAPFFIAPIVYVGGISNAVFQRVSNEVRL